MCSTLLRFAKDDAGATAIEYGLIAAGVAVVIIVGVNALGTKINSLFQGIGDKITVPS